MDPEIKEVLKGIKGNRDFYPEDYAEIKIIFDAMHNVSKQFGYELYEGPILEYAKLIEFKSGRALADETYRLFDREERKLVLRPEMTPSLARLISNQQQRYPKPLRWYSIPRVFRDETPQRGRVKEHFQFNADIFGIDHPAADAEIIAVTTNIIKTAGLKTGEFVCVINSRDLLQKYIEFLGIANYLDIIRILDSKGKFVQNAIEQELKEKGFSENEAQEKAQELRTIWQQDINITKSYPEIEHDTVLSNYLPRLQELEEIVVKQAMEEANLNPDQITKIYNYSLLKGKPVRVIEELRKLEVNKEITLAIDNLEELITYLEIFEVEEDCEFDMSIARGLDYYTGIVFEFLDRTGSVARAIAGGGRYDQLVEDLGGGKIPGTGIGMGETVLHSILHALKRIPVYEHPAKVYVGMIPGDILAQTAKIVTMLREHFSVIFNPFDWKFGKQLEDANNRSIPLMVIVGKRDLDENKVTVQDMATGQKQSVLISDLVQAIKEKL
ncbi:histidine--tRNA ligase family protein [Candidatus Heimdallarchaeota archaeon]|nr:MAG: histidine--tRNA ligase family protein [Candidatus Heimdallarchaeota archaeon]